MRFQLTRSNIDNDIISVLIHVNQKGKYWLYTSLLIWTSPIAHEEGLHTESILTQRLRYLRRIYSRLNT